jgi:hypothetical protein
MDRSGCATTGYGLSQAEDRDPLRGEVAMAVLERLIVSVFVGSLISL